VSHSFLSSLLLLSLLFLLFTAHLAAFYIIHGAFEGMSFNWYSTTTPQILLHFNMRPSNNDIVLNSALPGWGTEVYYDYSMLLLTASSDLFYGYVYLTTTGFSLYNISGTHLFTFPHRDSYTKYYYYVYDGPRTNMTRTYPPLGCVSNPCQNGATCVSNTIQYSQDYTCTCVCVLSLCLSRSVRLFAFVVVVVNVDVAASALFVFRLSVSLPSSCLYRCSYLFASLLFLFSS
jgi:hypothetical protein